MSAAHALATVSAATRPGNGANEDRYFLGEHFAVVLDGASTPDPEPLDGGWYADAFGSRLAARLNESHEVDLSKAVSESIADVAELASLTPGCAPSSTVAVFRWTSSTGEVLVLGDSPVIVQTATGIEEVRDDRLATVASEQRRAYRAGLDRGEGFGDHHRDRIRALVKNERAHRNRPDGYWIAEATPEAAKHARLGRWPLHQLRAVLLLTDGAAIAVDQFGTPSTWAEAITIARTSDLRALLDLVHDLEAADPDGRRWPRSKRHDDKTAVLVNFD